MYNILTFLSKYWWINEYIILYYSLWLIYDLDLIDSPVWSRLWEKRGVMCCRSWWCLSADFSLFFQALYALSILGFLFLHCSFYVFYPLQFPPQSSAASHTYQYCTCPHPSVLSVFIIDLWKCLYLYSLCAAACLLKVCYILSTSSTRDTTLCCCSITQEQKPFQHQRFQTE